MASSNSKVTNTKVTFQDIFILSKGRSGLSRMTWHILMDDHIPFSVVVEPQEAEVYRQQLALLAQDRKQSTKLPPYRVVVLPQDDQGVSFARNCILQKFAPEHGWFWIMDDDIQRFNKAENGKTLHISSKECLAEVSRRMAACLHHENIALFALEYQQFSFSYTMDDIAFNSYCNIAVCMTKDRMPPGLRYRFRVREDYDFVLQLIKAGFSTVRFRNLSFSVPGMGRKDGGMKAYYEGEKQDIKLQNKLFLEAWSAIADEVTKGTGPTSRDDIRVRWGVLNDRHEAAALLNAQPFKGFSVDPLTTKLGAAKRGAAGKRNDPVAAVKRERSVERAAAPVARPKRAQPPPPPPPMVPVRPKWRGWTEEKYRLINLEDLRLKAGLTVKDGAKLGDRICFVPIDPKQPPLVQATIVSVSKSSKHCSYTIIPERRGDPMTSTDYVFELPDDFDRAFTSLMSHYVDPEDGLAIE